MNAGAEINLDPPPPSKIAHQLRINRADAVRVLTLYVFMVAFCFGIKFDLSSFLSDHYKYFHMHYNSLQESTYVCLCLLTPLSCLPAGTRLETGAQFIFATFMAFVGLASPFFLVSYVAPDIFWSFYAYLFAAYFLLAVASRLSFLQTLPPLTEKSYSRLLVFTLAFFAIVFAVGMTQNFHVVSFAHLYEVRYSSSEQSGGFILRAGNAYMFGLGALFLSLALMHRKYGWAVLFIGAYVICYGLVQYKAAVLAPVWLVYLYFAFRHYIRNSTIKYYVVLTLPFWLALVLYVAFPKAHTPTGSNIFVWAYFVFTLFRQYATTPNALGLYYNFFQSHPVTNWSQITGVDFFLHYPFGSNSIAVEMQNRYQLGFYNSHFLATEGIASYGYQALPIAAAAVGIFFMVLNTASRGLPSRFLSLSMFMASLMLDERPFGTSLLTGGILFLILYLAWLPRSWMKSGA